MFVCCSGHVLKAAAAGSHGGRDDDGESEPLPPPPRQLHKPVRPLELLALELEPLKSTPLEMMQRLC